MIQKKVVPLHSQLRNQPDEVAMILGYGVMVTLQILVLSFLVRVRVSQLHLQVFFLKAKLGYGVMVTLQILVLSFLVRVRVSQLVSIFHSKDAFFLYPQGFPQYVPAFCQVSKRKPRAFALGL